jgi:hypothetical protein
MISEERYEHYKDVKAKIEKDQFKVLNEVLLTRPKDRTVDQVDMLHKVLLGFQCF